MQVYYLYFLCFATIPENSLGRYDIFKKAAEEKGLALPEPESFKASRGKGVTARVDGRAVLVGKPFWFEEMGMDLSPVQDRIHSRQKEGKTVMLVAADGTPSIVPSMAPATVPE